MRVTQKIQAVLNGRLPYNQLPPSGKSAISLPIYHRACEILKAPKSQRAILIEQHPETYREQLKAEIIRVHKLRA